MIESPIHVGVVGCGAISGIYLEMARQLEAIEIVAVADLDRERARGRAEEHGIARVLTPEALLSDPAVDVVLNLTIPAAHADIAMAAITAGKHVYGEKPLAITREQGRAILEAARANGVLVGCAPDTFLGGGLQTCRKVIDDGWIGRPVAATAFMMGHGPESWHASPEFFYKVGGGPLFDMGPYYLTALITLLGPIRRVAASTRTTMPRRMITSQPLYGTMIDVEVTTHQAGLLEFAGGAIGTMVTSFDVWRNTLPRIEIYGTEGTLSVPDPNTFGGPVRIQRPGGAWTEIPLTHGYADNSRGIGLADMACAVRSGRPHRASGALAYHVLDAMHAFDDSSRAGAHVTLDSTVERPASLPLGLRHGMLDLDATTLSRM